MEPKKEPKKAVLSPLLLLDFPPTDVNAVHRSRAGSFAADLCAKRTGKSLKITEKQARLFYRKFSGFSYARELSLRLSSYRRKQACFSSFALSPVGVQRALSARKSIPWDGFQRKAGRKAPDPKSFGAGFRAAEALTSPFYKFQFSEAFCPDESKKQKNMLKGLTAHKQP